MTIESYPNGQLRAAARVSHSTVKEYVERAQAARIELAAAGWVERSGAVCVLVSRESQG